MDVQLQTKIGNAKHMDGKQATVKTVLLDVLANRYEEDPVDGEFSSKLYDLHQRIYGAFSSIDLNFEDLGLLRRRVGKAANHSHYVIGFMLRTLPFVPDPDTCVAEAKPG